MMGTSHAATGVLAGAAVGFWLSPQPEHFLICAAIGAGAALLPDLDEPRSRVGRSLGQVTELVSLKLRETSRRVYQRTGTDIELAEGKDGGHRHLTHTVPACLVFGLVGLLIALVPLGEALLVLSMSALGLGTVARSLTTWGTWKQRRVAVWWISGVLGLATLWAEDGGAPAWLIGLTVFVGALTHILGDWLTKSGVPLAWPFVVKGKRWWMFRSPVAFHTGKSKVEDGIRVGALIGLPVMLMLGGTPPPVG